MKRKKYVVPITECYRWEPVGFLADSATGGDAGGLIGGGSDELEAKKSFLEEFSDPWDFKR